jgi:hypothetical protein
MVQSVRESVRFFMSRSVAAAGRTLVVAALVPDVPNVPNVPAANKLARVWSAMRPAAIEGIARRLIASVALRGPRSIFFEIYER